MDIFSDAVRIAESYCADVPDHVDVTLDKNSFAAGYLAAAGGIKQALARLRLTASALQPETDAATRMRDCCVEQLKSLHDEYESQEYAPGAMVLSKAIQLLESLTLEGEQEK